MDDFRLRVFVTAAQTLNFSRCAQLLGISQPAVSNHIKELESGYGMRLFDRTVSGLTLTPQGEAFMSMSEEILAMCDSVECQMKLLSVAEQTNVLRVVVGESYPRSVLSEAVAKFLKLMPAADISIVTVPDDQVDSMLESGAANVSFK